MILCLPDEDASIFNTRGRLFFIKSSREAFFVSFVSFYQQTFLATFYLILFHLSIQLLIV